MTTQFAKKTKTRTYRSETRNAHRATAPWRLHKKRRAELGLSRSDYDRQLQVELKAKREAVA